jgi:formiminoglutamase
MLRRYVCLGAQPSVVSRDHAGFVRAHGGSIYWSDQAEATLIDQFHFELKGENCTGQSVQLSLDADVVRAGDVPGVSAINPTGVSGEEVLAFVGKAARSQIVTSLELVEINPRFDRDGQSVRWAALAIWTFLVGRAQLSMACQ